MEFEIDYGTALSSPKPRPEGPLYASIDGMVAQLSPEECVFQVRGTDDVHVMTVDVLQAMSLMRSFRSLEAHYEAIENAIPALKGNRQAIERVVGFLVDRKLVIRAENFVEKTGATAEPAAPDSGDEPLIVVRTCDRPDALARLLASLEGLGGPLVVVDDSRDAATIAANRAAVEALDRDASHVDRAWRERLADHLAEKAGEDGAAISELLAPTDEATFTGGAAMNAGLLLGAGRRVVFLDDDMSWEPKLPPRANTDGLGVMPGAETPLAFLVEEGDALTDAGDEWFDRAIEAAGQSLGDASRTIGAAVDPATLKAQPLLAAQRLLDGARVRSVQFGYYGDSCMDTRLWLYVGHPKRVSAWWGDRSTYFNELRNPQLRQGFQRPQVTETATFTPAVVDATSLVPPAAPCDRGEDMVFTCFLRFLDPKGVTLNLPALLHHQRPEERPPENPDAFLPWATRFFAEYALAHMDECEAASPEERLAHLARRFEDLADAPQERLVARLREFLGYMRARIIQRLQEALIRGGEAPEYFLTDLRAWIEANGRGLTEARPPRLRGWNEDLDTEACAEALRDDAARFAGWLRCWGELWHTCRGRTSDLLAL